MSGDWTWYQLPGENSSGLPICGTEGPENLRAAAGGVIRRGNPGEFDSAGDVPPYALIEQTLLFDEDGLERWIEREMEACSNRGKLIELAVADAEKVYEKMDGEDVSPDLSCWDVLVVRGALAARASHCGPADTAPTKVEVARLLDAKLVDASAALEER
jgi:hypothetical protein